MKYIGRILKYAAVAGLFIIVLDVSLVLGFSTYRPAIKPADAIVVLGAAINTPALYNRSLQGLRLYEDGDAKVIVVSGGKDSPNTMPEAQYMEAVIEKNASNTVPIILEDQSHTTYENLKYTKDKISGAHNIIIVSDRFHLARAVLTAKRLGFDTVQWSAPTPIYYRGPEMAFYYLREMVAMISYIPKFIFG